MESHKTNISVDLFSIPARLKMASVFNTGSLSLMQRRSKKTSCCGRQNKAQHADNETLHHSHALRQCCLHTTGQNRLKLPNKKIDKGCFVGSPKAVSANNHGTCWSDKKNIYKEVTSRRRILKTSLRIDIPAPRWRDSVPGGSPCWREMSWAMKLQTLSKLLFGCYTALAM